MHGVLLERDAVGDLARHGHDVWFYVELAQRDHQVFVEFGDTHGPEHQLTEMSLARPHPQHVVDEIEIDLKAAAAPRNWGRRQPPRGHIKRHMPGVIEPRCQGEPDLADNLRPHVQRSPRFFPGRIGQRRPALSCSILHAIVLSFSLDLIPVCCGRQP
jgi:hypothetical protein